MSKNILNVMHIGMVISLYCGYGEMAAIRYITQKFSFSEEQAYLELEEIIQSDRYKEYIRQRKSQSRLSELCESYKKNHINENSTVIIRSSNKYSLRRQNNDSVQEVQYDLPNEEKLEKREKKKNTMVFIDAENISSDRCASIIGQSKAVGEIFEVRYYARQKDDATKAWKEAAKIYDIKPILLQGEPEKNKIDKKIIKDIKNILNTNKSIDVICIATRDGDYIPIVEHIKKCKKKAIVLATKNTSERLKEVASEVKGI